MTEHSHPNSQSKKTSIFNSLTKARATKPGETYGVPGQGDTRLLSVASILAIIFVWWLFTIMACVKPLFLPSP